MRGKEGGREGEKEGVTVMMGFQAHDLKLFEASQRVLAPQSM